MKKINKYQLPAYSAMASLFIGAGMQQADAQVVYHDIDPDVNMAGSCLEETYNLDLNLDGVNDFEISFQFCTTTASVYNTFIQAKITPLGSNFVAYSSSVLSYWGCFSETFTDKVVPVVGGGLVNGAFNFGSNAADLWKFDAHTEPCSTTYFFGAWLGAEDKYIPLKFKLGDYYHYAWVRLSIPEFAPYYGKNVIIKDFAYQAQPGAPIPITVTFVNTINWGTVADVGGTNSGADIQFTFNKPASEATIVNYKVIAVKSADAAAFNVSLAYNLAPDQYVSITPDGSLTYTNTLLATTRDTEGDLITGGTVYKLFVVSEAEAASGNASTLSAPSPEIILDNLAAPGVGYLVAQDVNDYFDSRDVQVSFNPIEPDYVSEYRLIIKKDDGFYLTLAEAEALPFDGYYSILPEDIPGDTAHVTIDLIIKDTDGDVVVPDQPYVCYVLSVGNGVITLINTLSGPSNTIVLQSTTEVVSPVTVTDIGENENGSDLQIQFPKASSEIAISEYRIFVVPEADIATFNTATAVALPPTNYIAVLPSGSDILVTGTATTKDIDGNLLVNNMPYKVVVASMADAVFGTQDTLSAPSPTIILITETAIATNIIVADVDNNFNGSDMLITFTKGETENSLLRYEIMVVPAAAADFFGLSDAETVSTDGNYEALAPTGEDVATLLNVLSTDINGSLIIGGVPYKIFVHSIDNGTGTGNKLSDPSNEITLSDVIAIQTVSQQPASVYASGNALHVGFGSALHENGFLSLTNMEGKKIFEAILSGKENTFLLNIPQGIYIATVYYNGQVLNEKICMGN